MNIKENKNTSTNNIMYKEKARLSIFQANIIFLFFSFVYYILVLQEGIHHVKYPFIIYHMQLYQHDMLY